MPGLLSSKTKGLASLSSPIGLGRGARQSNPAGSMLAAEMNPENYEER